MQVLNLCKIWDVTACRSSDPRSRGCRQQSASEDKWPGLGSEPGSAKNLGGTKKPLTYEEMLNKPCCYHTLEANKPANHSTRQCSWYQRTLQEGSSGAIRPSAPASQPNIPRPPPPTSGANAVRVSQPQRGPPPRPVNVVHTRNDNGAGPSNQVGQQQGNYREAHQSYVVFVTEPTGGERCDPGGAQVLALVRDGDHVEPEGSSQSYA